MNSNVIFTLGRGGAGKSEQLIACANNRPKETLFISLERLKDDLYHRGLNKSVMVVNTINDYLSSDEFINRYTTICIDNLEAISNEEYTLFIGKLEYLLNLNIHFNISSHLKNDYNYHPRLKDLSSILERMEKKYHE